VRVALLVAVSTFVAAIPTLSAQDSTKTPASDSTGNGRALASPLPSPPFPSGDWLGSPIIGEPVSTPDYALMHALSGPSVGNALRDAHIFVYGWLNPSVNFSTSDHSNLPLSYSLIPNHVEMDQAVLRFERVPNTVQTDHVDWGFRATAMYGTDYRFTTAKGYFSDQLLKHNNEYGFDPVELYALLYIPKVAQGLELKVGRFISPPDIEAQLAPDNYLFTHSIMFTYDPYTFTGVQATLRLSPQWQLEGAVHAGNDMAPWVKSASINGNLMVRWTAPDGNNAFWGGINSLGSGHFKDEHDNLQQVVGTWQHRFNDKWHMMTEAYYMWQFDGTLGGTCIDGPNQPFVFGGGCGPVIPGKSYSVGAVNYLQYLVSKKDYVSIRNDYFNDVQGQRSGFATAYTSHTVGFVHDFASWLITRPEVRFEHAYKDGVTPYDLGTRQNQFTFSTDVIVRF
jgi:hypothetical protein